MALSHHGDATFFDSDDNGSAGHLENPQPPHHHWYSNDILGSASHLENPQPSHHSSSKDNSSSAHISLEEVVATKRGMTRRDVTDTDSRALPLVLYYTTTTTNHPPPMPGFPESSAQGVCPAWTDKAYIDFEEEEGEYDRARKLYERLLEKTEKLYERLLLEKTKKLYERLLLGKTDHVISYSDFEINVPDEGDDGDQEKPVSEGKMRARRIFKRAYKKSMKEVNRVEEMVAAAKGLVALHRDERELFDPHNSGFGPLYPAITQPLDSGVISAAESLVALSHHGGDAISLLDGDDGGSASHLENPQLPHQGCYSQNNSGSADLIALGYAQNYLHIALEELVAMKRGRARRDVTARAAYYHSGNTTEEEDGLSDDDVSENEARWRTVYRRVLESAQETPQIYASETSDEEVKAFMTTVEDRLPIKLVLPARGGKTRDNKGKVTKRPRTAPNLRVDGEVKPGARSPAGSPPTRRSPRTLKKRFSP